jgi:pSer/pThr/pTyr-binding forkhead associated (FHA) protein
MRQRVIGGGRSPGGGEGVLEPLIVSVEDTNDHSRVEHTFTHSPVRIGRSGRNDLPLPRRFVSASHGVLEFSGNERRYTDLGSTNGTILNGAKLIPRVAVSLESGAELQIGSLRLTFPSRAEKRPEGEDAAASDSLPAIRPGGITAVMQEIARAPPVGDVEDAWRNVLFPGSIIGRFELVREIGRGSFGVVFEAEDRQLRRRVAFKAVRPGRNSLVQLRQERLQKEAEAIAQLTHPNIVTLYDAGACESGPYLVLELLRGATLREKMQRTRIELAQALEIGIEIAWALDHAHAAGVVHRDLKPANVFVCSTGAIKVLDFGIASVLGGGDVRAVGTPAYMAPEQWRLGEQDSRADVYAAAAILCELVTGRLPYRVNRDWSAALIPGARPTVEGPGVPEDLKTLLRSALAPEPTHRPRDGGAWLAALLAIQERLDRPRIVEPPPPERRRPTKVEWRLLAVAAGVVAAAAGALVYDLLR